MNPIKIRGLKQNNLKNVSLDIPKNKIVVFTGVSGSGKSSIVFETVAAESQRQMNETYSAWIRGRLPKYEKPIVFTGTPKEMLESADTITARYLKK